jgi:hypothetical protein
VKGAACGGVQPRGFGLSCGVLGDTARRFAGWQVDVPRQDHVANNVLIARMRHAPTARWLLPKDILSLRRRARALVPMFAHLTRTFRRMFGMNPTALVPR